mmetsp:Transcript_4309/g.11725  ORF Transcript_4309/g.11725 Transcript_4309/m.11725 type:complete len:241 (+) Transcript_4309:259-981(+)
MWWTMIHSCSSTWTPTCWSLNSTGHGAGTTMLWVWHAYRSGRCWRIWRLALHWDPATHITTPMCWALTGGVLGVCGTASPSDAPWTVCCASTRHRLVPSAPLAQIPGTLPPQQSRWPCLTPAQHPTSRPSSRAASSSPYQVVLAALLDPMCGTACLGTGMRTPRARSMDPTRSSVTKPCGPFHARKPWRPTYARVSWRWWCLMMQAGRTPCAPSWVWRTCPWKRCHSPSRSMAHSIWHTR